MYKQLLSIAVVSAACAVGTAATPYLPTMHARLQAPSMAVQKTPSLAPQAPARTAVMGGDESIFADIEALGELMLKVEEDFSLLTTGSEDEPDMMTLLTVDPMALFGNAWWSFNSQYTHTPNWGVNDSYPAGGCLYMDGERGQVHLNTPLVKLNEFSGIGVLEFRMRTRIPGSVINDLVVECAETNNMTSTWDFCGAAIVKGINNEWKTFRIVFTGCGPTTMFNIATNSAALLFLDDVKVYEINPHVQAPAVKPHSGYQGTSFTAHWTPVADADHYLLSVYTYNKSGIISYVLNEEKVETNSHEVTGLVSGAVYYYTVKSVKGDHVSVPSQEHRVYDLEAPVLNPVVETDDYTYKASWSEVPGADVYNYWALDKRVATEDGLFTVTNENFDGVLDADGFPTGWEMHDPDDEGYSYDIFYPMEMNQPGWHGTHAAPFTDYIAIDGWWYEWAGQDSGFISPELDLSKDGGKFTLSADLCGNESLWPKTDANGNFLTDANGEYIWVGGHITQACAALFNWDEELGDYRQVELVYPSKPVQYDWETFDFHFTKGSERSTVAIYAIRGLDRVFIDNLSITQNYKAGEYLMEPYLYKRFHGFRDDEVPTEIEISIPAHATGMELYHKVSAFGRQSMEGDYETVNDDRESAFSPIEYVRTTEKTSVGGIFLDESMGQAHYYDLNGLRVLTPTTPGVYVRKQGASVEKFIVK